MSRGLGDVYKRQVLFPEKSFFAIIVSTLTPEATMQIALTEPQEDFVKQAVGEGRYASEGEVIDSGLRLLQERDRRVAELRAMINASIEAGGSFTAEEMDADMEQQCKELLAEGVPC